MIFASAEPVSLARLAKASKLNRATVENIISGLNEEYIRSRRSFRIEEVGGGYRMYTLPEYHSYINSANIIERTQRLSQAALEALAVIAYKQPLTRAEVERIRGVDCGGVLKNLMAKNLIEIDGRSMAPGKPILYRTSEYFLEFFGLPSLDHLPPLTEIEEHIEGLPKLKFVRGSEDEPGGEDNEDKIDTEFGALDYEDEFDIDRENSILDEPVEDKVSSDN